MYTIKPLLATFLGAMLAASPIMALSSVTERDGSESVAYLEMYSSTDCSGDGQAYEAAGAMTEQACFTPGDNNKQSLAVSGV
ncbi:hypothetical protein N0V93_007886 [Gnomoniopsis smithogilvyi]|uniref:Uncharacterized protein n=1 Tax=Gnomoniopsis smithogilvyi TaxID=1191159 RepID=A0A9W8YP92_9PEZI|nr:hypothetical protein N0V93_007886 [Gnomoniopsis smithogilvyi]